MAGFLLDTVVISEFVKRKPNAGVQAWMESVEETAFRLSVLSIAELRAGILIVADSQRRMELESWLDGQLIPRFAGRILAFDHAAAEHWARIRVAARERKITLPVVGSQLAATAIAHNLAAVTRNVRHFEACGAPTIDPWTSS